MPSFITDDQLTIELASVMRLFGGAGKVIDSSKVAITAANVSAYWEIVSRLSARGFTASQIAAFDRGAEFQRSIGLYKILMEGGILSAQDYQDPRVSKLDRAKELDTAAVTNAGVFQSVQDGQPGAPAVAPTKGLHDPFRKHWDADHPPAWEP